MMRVFFFVIGVSLLLLTGLVSFARRNSVEPYYLEYTTLHAGSRSTCRLGFYNRPQECGFLEFRRHTSLSPDGAWRAFAGVNDQRDWTVFRVSTRHWSKYSSQRWPPDEIISSSDVRQYGSVIRWSPNGRWIAYTVFESDFGVDIYRVAVDTGKVERLTTGATPDWFPTWSPDGERIAFETRNLRGRGMEGLFTIAADGNDFREALPGLVRAYRPVWSPDGEWLLFQSDCPEEALRSLGALVCEESDYDLYRLRLADGHIETMVSLPDDSYNAEWSPDGQWVAFIKSGYTARQMAVGLPAGSQIYRVRPDGTGMEPVTNDPDGTFFSPRWATTVDLTWRPIWLLLAGFAMMGVGWKL